ncbi:MAG: hypothetical protein BWY76_02005 [bacterium ADurb.Bin429]|nr:MAG: hypothetical protein BWY76_02005 [bacterium ADurb.Bin429]
MRARQFREERFPQCGIIIEEAKVGVVTDNDKIQPGFRRFSEHTHHCIRFGGGDGITRRVIREVQDEHGLTARLARGERLTQPLDVETTFIVKERIQPHLRAQSHTEKQLIVLPELIRHQHEVSRVYEKIAHQTQGMGDAAGDDGQADLLVR